MYKYSVLTGCDDKYEFLIPWWIYKYRQHSSSPLIFADFGLSKEGRDYVEKHADIVIDINPEKKDFFWGMKARSVSACDSLSKFVLWIDIDCEINGDVTEYFSDSLTEDTFYIGKDVPALTYPGESEVFRNQLQAGLFMTSPKNKLFRLWLSRINENTNDQKLISQLAMENPGSVGFIPLEFHCPRLLLENFIQESRKLPNVIHWTGQIGHEILKNRMFFDVYLAGN